MFTSDFISRLKKISPYFRIDSESRQNRNGGSRITGLFYGDLHVCSVPVPVIPDEDVRNEDGLKDAAGLRSILRTIYKNGIVHKSELEKQFRISVGFGNVDYQSLKLFKEHIEHYKRYGNNVKGVDDDNIQ